MNLFETSRCACFTLEIPEESSQEASKDKAIAVDLLERVHGATTKKAKAVEVRDVRSPAVATVTATAGLGDSMLLLELLLELLQQKGCA